MLLSNKQLFNNIQELIDIYSNITAANLNQTSFFTLDYSLYPTSDYPIIYRSNIRFMINKINATNNILKLSSIEKDISLCYNSNSVFNCISYTYDSLLKSDLGLFKILQETITIDFSNINATKWQLTDSTRECDYVIITNENDYYLMNTLIIPIKYDVLNENLVNRKNINTYNNCKFSLFIGDKDISDKNIINSSCFHIEILVDSSIINPILTVKFNFNSIVDLSNKFRIRSSNTTLIKLVQNDDGISYKLIERYYIDYTNYSCQEFVYVNTINDVLIYQSRVLFDNAYNYVSSVKQYIDNKNYVTIDVDLKCDFMTISSYLITQERHFTVKLTDDNVIYDTSMNIYIEESNDEIEISKLENSELTQNKIIYPSIDIKNYNMTSLIENNTNTLQNIITEQKNTNTDIKYLNTLQSDSERITFLNEKIDKIIINENNLNSQLNFILTSSEILNDKLKSISTENKEDANKINDFKENSIRVIQESSNCLELSNNKNSLQSSLTISSLSKNADNISLPSYNRLKELSMCVLNNNNNENNENQQLNNYNLLLSASNFINIQNKQIVLEQ